ncbi:MAG: alpha/beta hydrolase, partial [Mycobacteriales bacterium]
MQPASVWFFVLVSVLTLGALVATAWSWNWERFKHIRRALALTLTQLMVVLSVAAGINVQQGFLVTWDDVSTALFGDQGANLSVHPLIAPRGGAMRQLDPSVNAAEQVAQRTPGKGVVVATSIRGARTGYTLPVRIYLPAAYFDKSQPQRIFPVLEFITGYHGSLEVYQRTLGADRLMDKLIAQGKMPPMIVVVPEQNTHLPADSECVNAVRGDQADTYVSLDVPDVLRQELRVSNDRSQ